MRCTLRHVGFYRTCVRCEALLELWERTLPTEKGLQSDTKARTIDVSTKIKIVSFLVASRIGNCNV